ncbi:MAG TPA: 2'-5' RNA ligase family protein [Chloroflexia bacterium]|nr:2'-5' RNA ligase family protein [Chloroflexia bacterium]
MDIYYGVYLTPPPSLLYSLSLAHQVLAAEFNARTASKFMVHCTLKGFFKPAPHTSSADVISALDDLFARTPAFTTKIHPPWVSSTGTGGESVLLWLERTGAIQELHNSIWSIIEPFVAQDCLFTPTEPLGEDFAPHITLVQSDLPSEPGIIMQGMALCRHIFDNLPTHDLLAQDVQLVEFYADDWENAWWETLRYRQIKGWQLPLEANHS